MGNSDSFSRIRICTSNGSIIARIPKKLYEPEEFDNTFKNNFIKIHQQLQFDSGIMNNLGEES